MTIVAENLQSLQRQIHLKDNEIDQLKSELETLRHEIEAIRSENQQNRPPPDITQYQANRLVKLLVLKFITRGHMPVSQLIVFVFRPQWCSF